MLHEPVAGVPGTVEAVEGLSGPGRGTPAAPAVEYLAALRICRLPGALSGRFGARECSARWVFGFGVAFAGARGVDGVERWAAPSPSAPGAVRERRRSGNRRAMPHGQPCAGPGAASSAGGFRGPLPVPPVAGRDLGLARRSQLKAAQLRWDRPHLPGAGARTGPIRGPGRSSRCICTSWSRAGAGSWGWRGSQRRRRWRPATDSTAPSGRRTSLEGRRWATSVCRRVWSRARGCWQRCPGQALTASAAHDRAAVKGYYRLIDQPAQSEVTPAHMLAPHRARTVQRMRGQQTVLCIQDGTDLNFGDAPQLRGPGPHRSQPGLRRRSACICV